MKKETRSALLALADEVVLGWWDVSMAIRLAVQLLTEGVDSRAIVLLAGESERYPPGCRDALPLVVSMLEDTGVGMPDAANTGWGIVIRDWSLLGSDQIDFDKRRRIAHQIANAFDHESRPDEVWWLDLADDESVRLPDEFQRMRFVGEEEWRQLYLNLGHRLANMAVQQLGLDSLP